MIAGFVHAPITKGILIIVSITSILVSLFQLKPFVHLQIYPHLWIHHQWYRLIAQQFAYVNSSELLLALLLLYNAGVKVERTFGTYKFASFLVVVTVAYTALQGVLLGVSSVVFAQSRSVSSSSRDGSRQQGQVDEEQAWWSVGSAPAGPWGPLFAILYQHHCMIPHLWSIRVGASLQLTDKHIQITSLGLLLACSQASSTAFSALLGIVVSALYRSTRLQEYRIPSRLYRILSLLLSPWIGQTRLPPRSWRAEPPMRRTLQMREARLAEHNAAVANLNRSGAGMRGIAASLLQRRRGSSMQTQGQPGVTQQQQQTFPSGTGSGTTSTNIGWNDVPPDAPGRSQ